MCGPWALPLAILAGGTGMQYLGSRQAERAQTRTYEAERARQQNLTREQQNLFDEALARASAMAGDDAQAAAIAAREAPLVEAVSAPGAGDYLPGSSSAPAVVRTSAERAGEGQRAESRSLARTIARLSGFGDQLFDNNIFAARDAGRIGQLGSFMAGSASAADSEMRAAANKGSTLRGIGSLAQAIGAAALGGGFGGAGTKATGTGVSKGLTGAARSNLAQLFGTPDVSWAFGG